MEVEMDYNKFNIEEKYDSYKNISQDKAKGILENLDEEIENKDSYDYHLLKGKMLLKIGSLDGAILELERALELDKTDEVFDLLSFGYYEKGDYIKSLYYIDLSFTITVDEYVYNHKGKVLECLGRYEESFYTYYNGLKFALKTYSNYGDVEIFGENVGRIGGILKNEYAALIRKYIGEADYNNLYNSYIKLLKVISMEEENDHYHTVNGYVSYNYLELIEEGKYILIDNDLYIEMIEIYSMLYDIESNSEYDDREYMTKDYIDDKVKALVDDLVERTSLKADEDLIVKVLDKVIALKNRDYYGYVYHKGFILMKLDRYDEAISILKEVIDSDKSEYLTKVQSFECIIKNLRDEILYCDLIDEYMNKFTTLLKEENNRILSSEFIHIDEKWRMCFQNCKRALNLNLNHDYWVKYMENISLKFGTQYEVITKNQTTYKTIVNYNKAVEIYDKIIEVNPKAELGYYRKGRAIVLALRLLNSSKTSLKDLVEVHDLGCFTYSEVIYNLNKAISINDGNGRYYNLLARTHFEIGEYDKARSYINKAVSLMPDELCANINLVFVMIRTHQYTEAIDYLFKISCKDLKVDKITKTFLDKKEILDFLMGIFNIYKRPDKIYFIMAYYFYNIAESKDKKAMTFINNAINISDDERYYLLRAKIHYRNGRYNEALSSINDAVSIEDHYDDAFVLKEKCVNKLSNS